MKEFKDLEFQKNGMESVSATLMFDNDYGISVRMGPFTKGGLLGKFEIAIVKIPPGQTFTVICYDTPIAQDVIGHLTIEEVTDYMAKIQELSKP
jgi:hypothetical protein